MDRSTGSHTLKMLSSGHSVKEFFWADQEVEIPFQIVATFVPEHMPCGMPRFLPKFCPCRCVL